MRLLKPVVLLALLLLALAFPVLLSPNTEVTAIAVFTLIYALAVTGWNIFSGYTGYISLGHAAYFGIGAYTLGLASQSWNIPGGYPPFLLLPLAGLVAGVFAIPLGWVALRVRRHVFIVVSIALLFIFQLLAYNLRGITNGSSGVFMPLTPWGSDVFDLPFYYVALGLVILATGLSWWVRHSKYGLGLLAIRDDEDRALGLGVKTGAFKLGAYVVSAIIVAMAGGLFAYYVGIIYPEFGFNPAVDVAIVMMAFLGGVGTLAGPLVGALLAEPIQYYLTLQFGGESVNLVLFGAFLLVILLVLPQGIVPSLQRKWTSWKASRAKGSAVPDTTNQERPVLVKKRGG
jgi:branched-chain amino acid transport system permease protein